MSAKTKDDHLSCAKRLLGKLKHQEPRIFSFHSDKKYFLSGHDYVKENKDVPTVIDTKIPPTVMVPGVVSNERDVNPSHFFTKLSDSDYKVVLERVVKA